MYDELVKRLHCQRFGNCPNCPMWYTEEVEPNLWRERCAAVDPADAIEELLQKMQQLPQWIPVTERLPEHDRNVLICYEWTGRSGTVYREVSIASIEELERDPTELFRPLYWMPLPEPPKEK